MSCVWHVGDLHLGHKAITKYRDVESVAHNNELMVENILKVVRKRDTLWLHGDIFFSSEVMYEYAPVLSERIGYLHLILGNHDFERMPQAEKLLCLNYLLDLGYQIHGLVKNRGIWLSHAPIHPDELRGSLCCHGHVHTATIDDPRYVNVSVDNTGFAPVKRQDILGGWRGC